MTYDEVLKAFTEELGRDVRLVRVAEPFLVCDDCNSRLAMVLLVATGRTGATYLCADRPACRARAKRLKDEREKVVVEAVKL